MTSIMKLFQSSKSRFWGRTIEWGVSPVNQTPPFPNSACLIKREIPPPEPSSNRRVSSPNLLDKEEGPISLPLSPHRTTCNYRVLMEEMRSIQLFGPMMINNLTPLTIQLIADL
ncbi:hypothetical protein TNIN_476651 [Trichonephila inaurata madagascariensis]|uniref:Uncharacterized protein n=1 Tax=Trichonephila inaurata madagascariensis TaxID=2747483 RepID=A0A8X6WUG9_9ARAC|nr:hypothetical protein TNIN_476651 [Trichonephila inaurata madagascariensis]